MKINFELKNINDVGIADIVSQTLNIGNNEDVIFGSIKQNGEIIDIVNGGKDLTSGTEDINNYKKYFIKLLMNYKYDSNLGIFIKKVASRISPTSNNLARGEIKTPVFLVNGKTPGTISGTTRQTAKITDEISVKVEHNCDKVNVVLSGGKEDKENTLYIGYTNIINYGKLEKTGSYLVNAECLLFDGLSETPSSTKTSTPSDILLVTSN